LCAVKVRSYRHLPRLIITSRPNGVTTHAHVWFNTCARKFYYEGQLLLDSDWEGLDKQYRLHYQAYFNIFGALALM